MNKKTIRQLSLCLFSLSLINYQCAATDVNDKANTNVANSLKTEKEVLNKYFSKEERLPLVAQILLTKALADNLQKNLANQNSNTKTIAPADQKILENILKVSNNLLELFYDMRMFLEPTVINFLIPSDDKNLKASEKKAALAPSEIPLCVLYLENSTKDLAKDFMKKTLVDKENISRFCKELSTICKAILDSLSKEILNKAKDILKNSQNKK